eukprot:m.491730 g.491730  ORF g.491730 m.491730 type:complete len:582 (-) comp30628_c0_seq1:30-1775(-)
MVKKRKAAQFGGHGGQGVESSHESSRTENKGTDADGGTLSTAVVVGVLSVVAAVVWWQLAGGISGHHDKPDNGRGHEHVPLPEPAYRECVSAGNRWADAGRLIESAQRLRECIALDQRQPAAYFNLAYTLEDLGDLQGALDAYTTAASLVGDNPNPTNPHALKDVHVNRAHVLHRLGSLGGAALAWRDAAAAAPGDLDILYSLANAIVDAGSPAEALPLLHRCILADNQQPKFFAAKARALKRAGKDKAEVEAAVALALQHASEAEPSAGDISAIVGQLRAIGLWLQADEPSLALPFLERAVLLASRQSTGGVGGSTGIGIEERRVAVYMLGRVLAGLGRSDDEVALYKRATQQGLFPDPQLRPLFFTQHALPREPWPAAPTLAKIQDHVAVLEDAAPLLRTELRAGKPPHDTKQQLLQPDNEGLVVRNGDWNKVVFVRDGIPDWFVLSQYPQTARVVHHFLNGPSANMPRCSIELSILSPGAHLRPHCGPSNHRLRLHLGIKVPEGPSMRVGNETRNWHEGKVLVLDDAWEHEVWNPASTSRVVLIVDVWHPTLAESERQRIRKAFHWPLSPQQRVSAPH